MAVSRWNDPANWTYANCSDNTKQPLISHLWETWKEAADEHVAFTEVSHSGGFSEPSTFPDLIGNLVNFGGGVTTRNAVKVKNSIYPEDAVETDSINSSGAFTGSSDAPDSLTLSQLLTGPLGYASGDLLSETETDSGKQNALFRTPWFVQWFEVMDYPEFYERQIFAVGGGSDYMTDVETQHVNIDVQYIFNGTTFISATAFLTTPLITSTPIDIYVANDLKETAPLSSMADVRDYAADLLAANSSTWSGGTATSGEPVSSRIFLDDGTIGPNTAYRATLTNNRVRFKVKDNFRATSPDKFTPIVKWNGFYDFVQSVLSTDYDFGTGETDQEMQFITLSTIADFYYLQLIDVGGTLPDYKSFAPPVGPGITTAETIRQTLSSVPASGIGDNFVMFNPNRTDGTGFEFYKP